MIKFHRLAQPCCFMTIHQCKSCGSADIKKDRSLGGRLVCTKCGSFTIGFKQRRNSKARVYQGYGSLNSGFNISPSDWQYLIPFLICLLCYLATSLFGILDERDFVYWSGGLLSQPYRILTNHFIHLDLQHLISNTFGIVIARHFFKALGLRNKFLFVMLLLLLIPLQTFLHWSYDIAIASNPRSFSGGLSGVLYGVDAFLLLVSIYGKQRFIGVKIGLSSDFTVRQTMTALTVIGLIFSLLPGVSLMGHLTGFIAGSILFLV